MRAGSGLSAALAQLSERVREELLGLLFGAALLHIRQVRLVRLRLRERRRVVPVATGGEAGVGVVDDLRDLLLGQTGGEVPHGLVAQAIPVRHRDAVGVEAVVLLAHGARSDSRAADRDSTGRHQITVNFVMSPRATIETNQTSASTTVNRLRLRSASPEEPTAAVMPPPNMSDRPPPRPLWRRMSRVSRTLLMPITTCSTNSRTSKRLTPFARAANDPPSCRL